MISPTKEQRVNTDCIASKYPEIEFILIDNPDIAKKPSLSSLARGQGKPTIVLLNDGAFFRDDELHLKKLLRLSSFIAHLINDGATQVCSLYDRPEVIDAVCRSILEFEKRRLSERSRVSTIFGAAAQYKYSFFRRCAEHNGYPIKLTGQETKVLECLLAKPGKPVTTRDIAKSVYGSKNAKAVERIYLFISRLREKLEDKRLDGVITTVRDQGYRVRVPVHKKR